MRAIRAATSSAISWVACRLNPVTCTSIGAGSPKFKIWLTMSAGWKKKVTPGKSRGSVSRSVFIQCSVG